jgi:hypothetical protein
MLTLPLVGFSQDWADDNKLDEVLNSSNAFGDDESTIVVIEYWASFNEANAFPDWDKLQNVQYFRVDVAKAPKYKKEHRVRMAPTIFIILDGVVEKKYAAGLDLECPVNLNELQEGIQEAQESSAF